MRSRRRSNELDRSDFNVIYSAKTLVGLSKFSWLTCVSRTAKRLPRQVEALLLTLLRLTIVPWLLTGLGESPIGLRP